MPNIDKIRVDGVDYNLSTPQIYDSQERIIGTWFGEPIYRQVISLTVTEYNNLQTYSNRKVYPLSSININKFLRGDVVLSYVDNNIYTTKTYPSHSVATNATYDAGVHNAITDALILVIGTSLLPILTDNIYIIIEYTKQTT